MKSWRLIARGEMEDLAQQIKTSTKLSENTLCDKPTTNTSSKTATINTNATLGRQCPLCKDGIIPLTNASPYCPDCKKALGEMITWWNGAARDWWVKDNSKKDRE